MMKASRGNQRNTRIFNHDTQSNECRNFKQIKEANMSNIPNEEVHTEESTRQFLLSDESYALLNNAKQKIKNETEVSPTLRKMIKA